MADNVLINPMAADQSVDPFDVMRSNAGTNAKSYLELMSLQGITNTQSQNAQRSIRTQQAQSGLQFGGAAAKQEIASLGYLTQQGRLQASQALSQLTESEYNLAPQIAQSMAATDRNITQAALPQLTAPVSALGNLYGGASAGLEGIFGLNQLF
ncbi:MAG: hypothetical protein DRJ03_04645 [Chloroflexi bacterium]|nr:MAG: hypothetical protein DRJ03_04645 [Chloroflexota bacterium]